MATALVAGLVSVLGFELSHAVFGVDIVGPRGGSDFADTTVFRLTVSATAGTVIAGVLVQVLLYLAARPLLYFGWIMVLVTAILVVWPFTTAAGTLAKVATSAVHFAIGVAVATLASTAARNSVRSW
jgi:cellulose synthase/poly-beta-1,6-N-acetylglucosamine synthase-like glycosyltransferase